MFLMGVPASTSKPTETPDLLTTDFRNLKLGLLALRGENEHKYRFSTPTYLRKVYFCVLLSHLLYKDVLTGAVFPAEVAEQSPEGFLIVGGGEKSGRRLVGADPKE